MVLAHWFERGLGQLLAPDASYDSQADLMDTASTVWQMIAPDPNFSPKTSSSSSAPPPPQHAFWQQQQQQQQSSLSTGGGAFSTPAAAQFARGHHQQWTGGQTPRSTTKFLSPSDVPPALQQEIVKASLDTARMAKHNNKYKDDAKYLFTCAMQKKAPTKETKDKIFTILQNDLKQHAKNVKLGMLNQPPPLYEARSYCFTPSCPDSHTPLQAAIRSGAYDVAQVILQLGIPQNNDNDGGSNNNDDDGDGGDKMVVLRNQLQRTNYSGQTAKHLAAETGSERMVDLILKHEQLLLLHPNQHPRNPFDPVPPPPHEDPVDVMGRTALAAFILSPPGKNKNNNKNSQRTLFSPTDKSLFGSPAPALPRSQVFSSIEAAHGTAQINGKRIFNEDDLHYTQWQYKNNESCGFFIVCDGHGDSGQVASFVAHKLPQVLRHAMEKMSHDDSLVSVEDWTRLCTTACLSVDLDLKNGKLEGGTVAVFCLVTKDQIVVGNVGDCRCILAEHKEEPLNSHDGNDDSKAAAAGEESGDTSIDKLAESMTQQVSLSGTDGGSTAMASESLSAVTAGGNTTVVATALTTDHKANLPEERTRVENAGLHVIDCTFKDENGNDRTKTKVQLKAGDDSNMVDFSRSFGDFEYKSVKGLSDIQQPVVPVPEVRVIDRNSISQESHLVLACDGVWDVKSNDDVANFVTEQVHRRLTAATETDYDDDILASVADDLLVSCIDSGDNLTTIIVALSQAANMVSSHQRRRHSMSSPQKLPFGTPQK